MSVYAHKLVSETAVAMANELYDECAADNLWYALNPNRSAFVNEVAPTLIVTARAVLTQLLQTNIPERQKDEIMAALVADQSIPRGPGVTLQ